MWLVEGLEDNRFALITKTHHCLVDGMAGVDLVTDAVRRRPDPPPDRRRRPWLPQPEPSGAAAARRGPAGAVDTGREIAGGLLEALTHPERTLARVREAADRHRRDRLGRDQPAARDAAQRARSARTGASSCVRERLDDLKEIKNAFGGTVNDVVLAVVAGALRQLPAQPRDPHRGARDCARCVPVSVRTEDEEGTMGNRITLIVARCRSTSRTRWPACTSSARRWAA